MSPVRVVGQDTPSPGEGELPRFFKVSRRGAAALVYPPQEESEQTGTAEEAPAPVRGKRPAR
jgi:hypothetical protein